MPRFCRSLTFFLCLAAFPVLAGDPTPEERFLADGQLERNIVNSAARSTVMVRHPCSTATYKAAAPEELKPMKFSEFGGPVAGELKFPVQEEGCGAHRLLNVYLWVQGENSIAITPMFPGSSHADDSQQKTAFAYALGAAGGPEPACPTAYVDDTVYVGEAGKPEKNTRMQAWKELWTLTSCSWRAEVPVTFTPGPTGLKVTAGPKSAVKQLPKEENKL